MTLNRGASRKLRSPTAARDIGGHGQDTDLPRRWTRRAFLGDSEGVGGEAGLWQCLAVLQKRGRPLQWVPVRFFRVQWPTVEAQSSWL